MAWTVYKKVYGMVPHCWLLECLSMAKTAGNVGTLLEKSMKSWRTSLTSGDQVLGEVGIRRGILQGDSLSPVLFARAMFLLMHIIKGYER